MPADAATLTRVDLAHRAQQAQVALRTARLIEGYWQLVDPDDLYITGAPWLRSSVSAVQAGRRESVRLASAYAEVMHQLQQPRSPRLEMPDVPEVDLAKLQRSLAFTGLGTVQRALGLTPDSSQRQEGELEAEAREREEVESAARQSRRDAFMADALVAATRSAMKLVVDGARDRTDSLVVTKVAIGYVRVTQSVNPCGFCLALASRGPAYEDDSFEMSDPRFTGPGKHKVHDGCLCTLRPIFVRDDAQWPEQARQADQLWTQFGSVRDGRSAMENFRREARKLGLADANRW